MKQAEHNIKNNDHHIHLNNECEMFRWCTLISWKFILENETTDVHSEKITFSGYYKLEKSLYMPI